MSGSSNFPTALDDDTSLYDVVDASTAVIAAHHNNSKEALKRIEAKVGVFNTSAPTSLDYRLGHPTSGHSHNAASGQGPQLGASQIAHLATYVRDQIRTIITMQKNATLIVGSNVAPPMILGKTMMLESLQGALRRGPSGATAAIDINIMGPGPTSVFHASQLFRPIFPPGATAYVSSATPNYMTYPSGAVITMDVDAVGSSEPGQDLTITFIFRNTD